MNRRLFLRTALHTCCTLYFGQNLLQSGHVLANSMNVQSIRVIKMYWLFSTDSILNQRFFRIYIDTSDRCEFLRKETSQYVEIIIKNCNADQWAGSFPYPNEFISSFEVKQINQKDIEIRIYFAKNRYLPEMRCILCSPTKLGQPYGFIADIGTFSLPTAIKESDLAIKETNLVFGPLEPRPDTTFFVIHHVGLTDDDFSAAQIHELHLANGWSGIGYHYVIRKDGTIERGRPRDDVGAHTYEHNTKSIGINVVGNFEYAIPQDEQIESAGKLIAALCHIYNISPDETTILGHKDIHATLCPGANLYERLGTIREKALYYFAEASSIERQ